jgi:eukaryotic-like serine/threonine-protein kinase
VLAMTRPTVKTRSLSRYELLRQLGQGPATRKFLALSRGPGATSQPCVLDLMQEERAGDDDFRALLLDQAAATLDLGHAGLVRTLEVVADADGCGFVTEFLEGQTLAAVLSRVGRLRLPVDVYLHILSRVLEALEYLHGQGSAQRAPVVHGNVCPSNVFITYDGAVKLLGSGFAEVTRALEAKLGVMLVDRRYAAPEVLLGQAGEPGSDLYGVGVMLWEALTREPLVRAAELDALVDRRSQGRERELEEVWPEAAEPLVALCRRALSVESRNRHASAAELRAELGRYLQRAGESTSAVLGRLPSLLEGPFRSEREELRHFVRARAAAGAKPALAQGAPDSTEPASSRSGRRSGQRTRVEPDTGGHRAYSTSVVTPLAEHASPPRRFRNLAASAGVLALLTLAGAGIVRQASRHGASSPVTTAAATPGAGALAPTARSARGAPEIRIDTSAIRAGADAGVEPSTEAPPAAAFFDGQVEASADRREAAPLTAEDLPSVDTQRDSLQDAIVRTARRALRRKPGKRGEATLVAPELPPGPALPRSIDEADPYLEHPPQ